MNLEDYTLSYLIYSYDQFNWASSFYNNLKQIQQIDIDRSSNIIPPSGRNFQINPNLTYNFKDCKHDYGCDIEKDSTQPVVFKPIRSLLLPQAAGPASKRPAYAEPKSSSAEPKSSIVETVKVLTGSSDNRNEFERLMRGNLPLSGGPAPRSSHVLLKPEPQPQLKVQINEDTPMTNKTTSGGSYTRKNKKSRKLTRKNNKSKKVSKKNTKHKVNIKLKYTKKSKKNQKKN